MDLTFSLSLELLESNESMYTTLKFVGRFRPSLGLSVVKSSPIVSLIFVFDGLLAQAFLFGIELNSIEINIEHVVRLIGHIFDFLNAFS